MTCRSFQEYVDMFQLSNPLFTPGPILDVAAGASSFTAEANRNGYHAIAVDPLYRLDPQIIHTHGQREIEESTAKLTGLKDFYDWSYYGSLEAHQRNRERSLQVFVRDYSANPSRYIDATVPDTGLEGNRYALILCSHFLFLYADQFDVEFHIRAIRELIRLCRPGGEIRLYPLSTLKRERYPHMTTLLDAIRSDGVTADITPTPFRFLQSADAYLRIVKP